jgi:hypothetical protein
MAINVTVAGVGGTTVTIPFTTQGIATSAQAALGAITSAVAATTLTQVAYTGGSTLPGAGTPQIGVVDTSNSAVPLSPFAIGGNYVAAVLGGASSQAMLIGFGSNQTVVAGAGGSTISSGTIVTGAGGAAIANLGTNSQVFFGGAASQSFTEVNFGGLAPSATVWVDNAFKGITTFDNSAGSTTINITSVASAANGTGTFHPYGQVVAVTDNGTGSTTLNIKSSSTSTVIDGVELKFLGNSSVATTVNAAAGVDSANAVPFLTAFVNTGSAFINGNGSEVVMFSTGPQTGVATLFGGSGTDIDVFVGGLIIGGSHTTTGAGVNILLASNTQSTTLVGGGSGDVLVALSKGNLMVGGTGTQNLFASAPNVMEGVGVTTIAGGQALPSTQTSGGLTNMYGFSGGDTFMSGAGNTSITAVQDGGGNLFVEGVSGKNTAGINNFLAGTDTISLAKPGGGTYTLETTGAPSTTQVELAATASSAVVTFGDGTTWTFNTVVKPTDFH